MASSRPIVLASGSPYRRELLERFHLPFECRAPGIDEAPRDGEPARDYVLRLSREKAEHVARAFPGALVIGSDQVALCGKVFLPKPGTAEGAMEQLRAVRGREVAFITGLCLLDAASGECQADVVDYHVSFRDFSDGEARRYVETEQPFDCAASFRSERLGMALVDTMRGADPTALIGLPLLRLAQMLRAVGVALP